MAKTDFDLFDDLLGGGIEPGGLDEIGVVEPVNLGLDFTLSDLGSLADLGDYRYDTVTNEIIAPDGTRTAKDDFDDTVDQVKDAVVKIRDPDKEVKADGKSMLRKILEDPLGKAAVVVGVGLLGAGVAGLVTGKGTKVKVGDESIEATQPKVVTTAQKTLEDVLEEPESKSDVKESLRSTFSGKRSLSDLLSKEASEDLSAFETEAPTKRRIRERALEKLENFDEDADLTGISKVRGTSLGRSPLFGPGRSTSRLYPKRRALDLGALGEL